jgi:hypothetical protein
LCHFFPSFPQCLGRNDTTLAQFECSSDISSYVL